MLEIIIYKIVIAVIFIGFISYALIKDPLKKSWGILWKKLTNLRE